MQTERLYKSVFCFPVWNIQVLAVSFSKAALKRGYV